MRFASINSDYTVHEDGLITTRRRAGTKGGTVKQWKDVHGYWNVRLTIDGKPKNYRVHRLLATAFIPNPVGLPQINHKDGNPANNTLSNLEWCTVSQNLSHAYKLGLKQPTRKAA
jgi:hypothetical protein